MESNILDLDAHLTKEMASHFVFACLSIRRLQDANNRLEDTVSSLFRELELSRSSVRPLQAPITESAPPSSSMDNIQEGRTQQRSKTPAPPMWDRGNASAPSPVPLTSSTSTLKPSSSAKLSSNSNLNKSVDEQKAEALAEAAAAKDSRNADSEYTPSTSLEIGLKLVSALPPDAQPLYSKLVSKPQLMLESLIMGQRFDCLQALFEFMPSVFRDELFFDYTNKALNLVITNYDAQIKVGLETIRGPFQSPSNRSGDGTILTGDAKYDDELRSKHRFGDTPNSELAVKLLSFCDEIKAGYFTVQLCESYNGYVTGFASYDLNLRMVEALRKMLQFGKVLFLKHPVEAHSGIIELCDSFLSQLDLIGQIVQSKKPLQVQIADFADQNKARALRDKLLEFSEFEIARDLCLKTNTPAEVVTVAWALQHIRNGKFPEARQMLVQVLVPASFKTSTNSSTSSSGSNGNTSSMSTTGVPSAPIRKASTAIPVQSRGIDTQMVIENILQILDPPKPSSVSASSSSSTSHPSLSRTNSGSLSKDKSGSASQNGSSIAFPSASPAVPPSTSAASTTMKDKRKTLSGIMPLLSSKSSSSSSLQQRNSIDSGSMQNAATVEKTTTPAAIEECLFYLERFGTNAALLRFYTKHSLLEKACQHVLMNRLEADVFLEKIVVPCIENCLLGELKAALEKVDANLERSQPYLMSLCKYLNEQKAFKTLVTFQVFMKDYVRAALTCIRLFMDTSDPVYRIKCLEIAKNYFDVALKDLQGREASSPRSEQTTPAPIMSAADMSSYMMKIDIQLEVLKVLTPLMPKLEATLKIPMLADYTLFGPPAQRSTITWILMVNKLELGLKVLSDTIKRDEWPAIFTNAGIYAARHLSASQAWQVVENVKAAGADSEWLDMLMKAEAEVMSMEKKDLATAEKLAKHISHPKLRCVALVDAGKLKSAYLEAVKLDDPVPLVALIMSRAESEKDTSVVKLCTSFTTQYNAKLSNGAVPK